MSLSRHVIARPLVDQLMRYPSVVIVDSVNGAVRGVRWEVEGDAADWERIQAEGWFGVRPDVLGPIYGGDFVPDLAHIFTLQLQPYVLRHLAFWRPDPKASSISARHGTRCGGSAGRLVATVERDAASKPENADRAHNPLL